MPLPPALAAKLAKRGIIKNAELPTTKKATEPNVETEAQIAGGPTEEIIAESYDEGTAQPENGQVLSETPLPSQALEKVIPPYLGYSLCPNKWNVYHDCTQGCMEVWGRTPKALDREYERKRAKMLNKYPLPANWMEVLDPGIGRYYYWNCDNEFVSWLPPGHPKCSVSRSAADLRRVLHTERAQRLAAEAQERANASDDSDESSSTSSSSSSDSEDEHAHEKKKLKRKRSHSVEGSEEDSD
ncbi:WW domain, partial [Trinorchestia longiramus]